MSLLMERALRSCTEVSAVCPVKASVLGYYPNLGSNIFFAIAFGICFIASAGLGIWKRTWSYMIAITIGCALEMVGYIGRVLMNSNPWNKDAFQTQIVAIILSPTVICISIYLTLKHISLNLNPELSRLKPRHYPLVFLPADLSCLIVQAIGGGIAAAAGRDGQDKKLLDSGNRAIIAGIVLQVVVLIFFGIISGEYYMRVRRWVKEPNVNPASIQLWNDGKFRLFVYGVTGAYGCILLRCIYRIAEMAGGWGNYIMQDEPSFIILDGCMILIAVTLLTFLHPGILFPQMSKAKKLDGEEINTAADIVLVSEERKEAESV